MGVLSLVVWGLSIPAAATCQLMLPAISSLTVYWWLIFVTGEVGRDATWMLIDLPLEGSCFHLPAIYLPDYSNVRQSRAVGSQASLTVSPETAREGGHRKAWEFCLLSSFNWKNALYTFHVYMHFEKGCLKRITEMTER